MQLGSLTTSSLDESFDSLRRRYQAEGYLWLKNCLPQQQVLDFRGWVFEHLAPYGLHEHMAPKIQYDRQGAGERLMMLVQSATFEGFCTQPSLVGFMEVWFNGIPYLHKRKILRYVLPGSSAYTAAHYDQVYLRAGADEFVTVWIPIGDVGLDQGGLIYLKGSPALGLSMETHYLERAKDLPVEQQVSAYNRHMNEGGHISQDLPALAQQFNSDWLAGEYAAGDVVLHSPYTIHASTLNRAADNQVRLSADIRFQNRDSQLDPRWSNHWQVGDGL